MKIVYRSFTGILLSCLLISLSFSVAYSEGKAHLMTGEISGISLAYRTVVIQVPLGSQMFTVGGPLDPDATLTKNGKSADLKEFKVGETATVRWRSTPTIPCCRHTVSSRLLAGVRESYSPACPWTSCDVRRSSNGRAGVSGIGSRSRISYGSHLQKGAPPDGLFAD